jgi:peptidoglycan/xylan/chitin deacetylase (PgdA/CDA1 family)
MNVRMIGALLFLWFGASAMAAPAVPFAWPNGAKCAVSLTYDDALSSQLNNAVPALDKAGLHGTFYLSGAPYKDAASLALWKPAARAGHELGSHTVEHPCSSPEGKPVDPNSLEAYDLARMDKELVETTTILKKIGHDAGQTFAYPCGRDYVGLDKTSYRPLIAKRFSAARNAWGGVADPLTVDLNGVPTVSGSRIAKELISDVDAAKRGGGWAVFLFHGVGGDYLEVSSEAHQALVDYLRAAKGEVWVSTFEEVASWVKTHRK